MTAHVTIRMVRTTVAAVAVLFGVVTLLGVLGTIAG
jgi:hypothetical protein